MPGGERQREEGHRGARSQSAVQITAQPTGRSADSRVGSELPPPPLLLATSLLQALHHSRCRRTDKSLSIISPSRISRCLLLNRERKGREGEKGVRDD